MRTSDSIDEICKALVGFHSEVGRIDKDGKNPHFQAKYATIDNIMDEIRPILAKHKLFVMQPNTIMDDGSIRLVTRLYHESGQLMESDPIMIRPQKNDAQGIGSAITYARRYSLTSFLSLTTGDDDDGNAASQSVPESKSKKVTNRQGRDSGVKALASDKQRKAVFASAKEKGLEDAQIKQLVKHFTAKNSTKELTKEEAHHLIETFRATETQDLLEVIGGGSV